MKHKLFAIIIISFLVVLSCNNKDEPLYKALEDIESSWSNQEMNEFVIKNESDAVSDIHFGYAMNYRNKVLRKPKDSSLIKYFHSLNIYHLEDMSNIIFTSLHRKQNGKPIDLEDQLKPLLKYWNELKECRSSNLKRALKYFQKYDIGDTIIVRMPIRNNRTAIQLECPDDSNWVYDDIKDMLIEGVIKEKNNKDTLEMLFTLKVLSMNHDSIQILMEDVNIGDEIETYLMHDIVEDGNVVK